MLRPGLYTGFYHPEMYGKFCKECVLIEYKKLNGTIYYEKNTKKNKKVEKEHKNLAKIL